MITATVIGAVVWFVMSRVTRGAFRPPVSDSDKLLGGCAIVVAIPAILATLICGTWALVRWINT